MNLRLLSIVALSGLVIGSQLSAQEAPARGARPLLGVLVEPTAPDTPNPGMKVLQVTPGSPAADAGILRGDVINKLDDKNLRSIDDFFGVLGNHKPGDKVKVQVLREGKEQALTATLGERRPRGGERERTRPSAFLGIDTQPLNPGLKERAGVSVDAGAFVADVMPDSPAAKAGLQRGDVIVSFNGKNVTSPADLRAEVAKVKPNEEATLKVARGKETKELKAKLESPPAGGGFTPPTRELPGPLGEFDRRIQALEKRVQELEKKLQEKK
jgi:serine protease Do